MSDPGLVILPTHRLVSGFPDLDADQLASILGDAFPGRDGRHGRTRARATPGS